MTYEDFIDRLADKNHLSWVSDTYHNMVFEILFSDYKTAFESLSELLRSEKITPRDFDSHIARLNTSYIFALKYFGI